ncbi:hypothetical protein SDC9_180246 [bioreactor metagenome]|uniref:Uncharacterized protein n=1 Tax=bioreactor metagenome TaxID=1076179 RepID=A0A645H2Q5_9ZZZZ
MELKRFNFLGDLFFGIILFQIILLQLRMTLRLIRVLLLSLYHQFLPDTNMIRILNLIDLG